MSYILDALQRADAERERGHVPGLNSQIVPPAQRKLARPRRGWRLSHSLALVVALALLAAGLWWWFARTSAATSASATSTPNASGTVTAQASPQASVDAPPTQRDSTPAASSVPSAPKATPAPVLPILAPPRPEPPKPAATAAAPAPAATAPRNAAAAPSPAAATPAPAAPAATPAPAPAPASEPNAARVRSFAELSPEARAQLPPTNVSGSTYSKNAALRMLIVNGKVLQEGQEIAPGFKLETIGQRSAVLNHNGLRYSIGY